MYGYGLEGYGYEGEGFRYPPVQGYYDEPITVATIRKGPRTSTQIKIYPPKVDERWVATYLLNKKFAEKSMWRQFATKALQQASEEYLKHLLARDPEVYKRALENKQKREAKKGQLPLALRSQEGQKLYQALKDLEYKDLLARYYSGRKPGKIPKKVRAQLAELMPKK
jgi:hypothetical protein